MDRILIVSSGEKSAAVVVKLVKEIYPNCAQSVCSSGGEARRAISENEYDAIIINSPLSDEYGNDLAEYAVTDTDSGCLLIVRSENVDGLFESMGELGALVIAKPLSRGAFYQALRLMNASRRRMLGIRTENVKLHKRLEELHTINRAKFALMQYLSFTEEQAHKYIEKQAMNMRCTKLDVAQTVINTYESK